MRIKLFSVFDSKSETFDRPFYARTAGEAVRIFEDACNDPKMNFFIHPGDFTLFEVGSFDLVSGDLVCAEHKVNLGLAVQFKKDGKSVNMEDMVQ